MANLLGSPWVSTTLLVLLLASWSLQLWGLNLFGTWLDADEAGTWGDLTGSIGSVVAVIIAVASLVSDRRKLREEKEEQDVEERTRVYAWLEPRTDPGHGRAWLLRFENQTRIPVYDWSVTLAHDGRKLRAADLGPIRPGGSDLVVTALGGVEPGAEPKITLEFVDRRQVRWVRNPNGDCIPVRATP